MSYTNNNRNTGSYKNNKGNTDIVVKIDRIARHMLSLNDSFNSAGSNAPHISFERECIFAKHIVNNNNYLADIAVTNPKSFETAFLQLASSGLTLDPAQKQAYLVPRDGRVILDVSYIGLSRMATDEGLCQNIVAELVFEKDVFKTNGRRASPEHVFDPFAYKGELVLTNTDRGAEGQRGIFRGAYVDYLMKDGQNLVFFIDLQDLAQSRSKSDSWAKEEKRQYSPWVQFPWKMVLKSAIKQSIHLIPGNRTRLSSIIEYLNTAGGEGFQTATIPVAAAEAEMEVRQQAKMAESNSSNNAPVQTNGNIIEGEFHEQIGDTKTTGLDENQNSKPSEEPSHPGDDAPNHPEPQSPINEEMSEQPGVRMWVERRIRKLVKRAEETHGYETILNESLTQFEFNGDEIKFARLSLEQSRRSMLKNLLISAVGNCDFSIVQKFVDSMGDGKFKNDAAKWISEVEIEAKDVNRLYLEAVSSLDFSMINEALKDIKFMPLKEIVENLVSDLQAA